MEPRSLRPSSSGSLRSAAMASLRLPSSQSARANGRGESVAETELACSSVRSGPERRGDERAISSNPVTELAATRLQRSPLRLRPEFGTPRMANPTGRGQVSRTTSTDLGATVESQAWRPSAAPASSASLWDPASREEFAAPSVFQFSSMRDTTASDELPDVAPSKSSNSSAFDDAADEDDIRRKNILDSIEIVQQLEDRLHALEQVRG